MTKVDIISGFLGAGKTTFIRKMIEEAFKGEKVVLIENEFGEVGIDGGFLKDAGIQITEMNQGCICCSLVGDFDKNLREVIEKFSPDRIIIEPSGVGKLSDVMTSIINLEESHSIKLNGLVTIVNAKKALKQMKAFGEFFNNQVEYASTICLSRTQDMDEKALEDTVKHLREHNEKAAIITTPWDKISGEQILKAIEGADSLTLSMKELAEEAKGEHEHHHEHDHDEHEHEHHHHEHIHEGDDEDEYGIGNFVYYRRRPFNRDKLEEFAGRWPRNIIRCKGVLWFSDEENMAYVFETSGRQISAGASGQWLASCSKKEQEEVLASEPKIRAEWDEKVGDRMIKLCIIGQKLDKDAVCRELDALLD